MFLRYHFQKKNPHGGEKNLKIFSKRTPPPIPHEWISHQKRRHRENLKSQLVCMGRGVAISSCSQIT